MNRKVAESLVITGAFDRLGETRATLLHNLDRVMEVSAKTREAKRYGQVSLFEGVAGRPRGRASSWSACPSCPRPQLLESEKAEPRVLLLGPSAGSLAGAHRARR